STAMARTRRRACGVTRRMAAAISTSPRIRSRRSRRRRRRAGTPSPPRKNPGMPRNTPGWEKARSTRPRSRAATSRRIAARFTSPRIRAARVATANLSNLQLAIPLRGPAGDIDDAAVAAEGVDGGAILGREREIENIDIGFHVLAAAGFGDGRDIVLFHEPAQ